MGPGSASPVVSTMTRAKGGTAPAFRRPARSESESTRSPRTEQQMQPLLRIIVSSAASVIIA